jgi:truncated hemoglobin YjbI
MESNTNNQKLSLYHRLGGETRVRKIVNDILDKNLSNPLIGHHFRPIDMNKLKELVFEFFSMGTGGPHQYTGRDMRTSHANLNITEQDFEIANEDTLAALEENGVSDEDKKEIMSILNSMKSDVVTR